MQTMHPSSSASVLLGALALGALRLDALGALDVSFVVVCTSVADCAIAHASCSASDG